METKSKTPSAYTEKIIKDMQEIFLKELEGMAKRENFDITCILHISLNKTENTSTGAIGFLFRGNSKLIVGALRDCRDRIEDFEMKHMKEKISQIFTKYFGENED